jgi:hypothetical protein
MTDLAVLEAESHPPLIQLEAERFGSTPYSFRRRDEQCRRGHWFTIENTAIHADGHRYCRTCHRQAQRLSTACGKDR